MAVKAVIQISDLSNVSQNEHPDHAHIKALLSNDSKGISLIYTRFSGKIERYVCGNSGNAHDARDLFQDALLDIARQAAKPDFVLTCPFEAYLYMVCHGKWMNELKKRQRQKVTIGHFDGYTQNEAADTLAERTLTETNQDALFAHFFEKLPNLCKDLIRSAWTGESLIEVAERLGKSYAYVRKRKGECIKHLTDSIRESPDFNKPQTLYGS